MWQRSALYLINVSHFLAPARSANSIPCQLLTPQLSSDTHTHTCKLWRESVILFSCAPQLIYLTVTHSCKHLWELCQTEVNLRLALSALASRAHFFFLHLPLPKSSQLPWLCHVRSVCAGVSVCVHRAHFAALKFYNVARFRKSKRISADVKQLMCVFSESKSTTKQP